MTARIQAPADNDANAIIRRYYLLLASVFVTDLVMSAIFIVAADAYYIVWRNFASSVLFLLLGGLAYGRYLFGPIARYLRTGQDYAAIQRNLTQLPIRSAFGIALLSLPMIAYRLVSPYFLSAAEVGPRTGTWLDTLLTTVVLMAFFFVFTYFVISDYLARLCEFIFNRDGVNLQLYFGRFATKLAWALLITSILPMLLVLVDVNSYDAARARIEVMVDVISTLFGIGVSAVFITRSLILPLNGLAVGMKNVAEGDLSVRLPITSNDEVGKVTGEFNRMIDGLQERAFIRETLGKYVSEEVATQILKDRGRLAGEVRAATLVFIDIQGFTTLSERLEPQQVIALLNEFTDLVLEPIRRHGGVVNNFIGDGIFASFNLPLACESHGRSAILAALDIHRSVAGRSFDGGINLAVRIGINSGPVVAGTVGSGERLTYSILGDAVNVANRVEQLNKELGTSILVTDATRKLAGDGLPLTHVGDITVRGRSEAIGVYRLDPS